LLLISGFRCDDDEVGAVLGYYTASNGNPLPTFRKNVSVPSSRVKKAKKTLEDVTDTCPETSVKDYHSTLRNTPEERRSHILLLSTDYVYIAELIHIIRLGR
jgi:hypothetical protein